VSRKKGSLDIGERVELKEGRTLKVIRDAFFGMGEQESSLQSTGKGGS